MSSKQESPKSKNVNFTYDKEIELIEFSCKNSIDKLKKYELESKKKFVEKYASQGCALISS